MIRYYITDRKSLGATEAERWVRLLECVERACVAGIEYLQLREKDLSVRELETLARQVMRTVNGRTKVLLNARTDVALAMGADGVHLPSGDLALNASEVRTLWMKASRIAPVIGVSCHAIEEIGRAEAHAADFAVFGPVFAKKGVKSEDGLQRLEIACRRSHAAMPVLALGGVNEANAELCLQAGAAGWAGIRSWQKKPHGRWLEERAGISSHDRD